MAMANGGYGGYGGAAGGYHQDHHHHHHPTAAAGGGHDQGHSNTNGGVLVSGGGGGEHLNEDDGEEIRRLTARIKEVDLECHLHSVAANEVQTLLEDRAVARLETERKVKRMIQEHEQKMQEYEEKSREIDARLTLKDKEVKELTIRNQRTKAEVDSALKRRKDMVDQIKKEEREAIEAEERRREKQRHDSASSGGGGGSGQKEKDAIDSTIAIGAGMGRRTHSHPTEASFHYRRASTGARVGPAEAERAQRSEKERSNGQPRRFEQIRQSRVEDTLTDFFGL